MRLQEPSRHLLRSRSGQWGVGNVGTVALRHFVGNPAYEVVGVLCNRPEKVGKDAGELVGAAPIGVLATTDKEAI